MKVLIACECSGIVREAFAKAGHDVQSCDYFATERQGNHIQGDVRRILNQGWDLMIAHPPCRYLTFAGVRHWKKSGHDLWQQKAMEFFMELIDAPIPRICVENPVGLPGNVYRKPDQIVHPYYFGEPIQKRTCFWLKNLNPLVYDHAKANKPPPVRVSQGTVTRGKGVHHIEAMKSGHHRSRNRSRFFESIAKAMADQWGTPGNNNFEERSKP